MSSACGSWLIRSATKCVTRAENLARNFLTLKTKDRRNSRQRSTQNERTPRLIFGAIRNLCPSPIQNYSCQLWTLTPQRHTHRGRSVRLSFCCRMSSPLQRRMQMAAWALEHDQHEPPTVPSGSLGAGIRLPALCIDFVPFSERGLGMLCIETQCSLGRKRSYCLCKYLGTVGLI